jgi:hypothetical protein
MVFANKCHVCRKTSKKIRDLGRFIGRTISMTINTDDLLLQTFLEHEDIFTPDQFVLWLLL